MVIENHLVPRNKEKCDHHHGPREPHQEPEPPLGPAVYEVHGGIVSFAEGSETRP